MYDREKRVLLELCLDQRVSKAEPAGRFITGLRPASWTGIWARVPGAPCAAGQPGRLRAGPELSAPRTAAEGGGSGGAVRDPTGTPGAYGLRGVPPAGGTTSRAAGGAGLLVPDVVALVPSAEDGGALPGARRRVRAFRGVPEKSLFGQIRSVVVRTESIQCIDEWLSSCQFPAPPRLEREQRQFAPL